MSRTRGADMDVRQGWAAADESAMSAVGALVTGHIATHPRRAPCGGGCVHSKRLNRLHGSPISQGFRAGLAVATGRSQRLLSPRSRLSGGTS